MRADFIANDRKFHFLQEIFARIQSKFNKTEIPIYAVKELGELSILLLLSAALLAAISFCTIVFFELCIRFFLQRFSIFLLSATIPGLQGYIYNLKTIGLASGKYVLSFYAGSDTTFFYTVEFEVK